jgi:hypothetical protein
MTTKTKVLEWLRHRTEVYRSEMNGNGVVEDMGGGGKLGQGFTAMDKLKEVDIGSGSTPRPTYLNTNMPQAQKEKVCCLL